MYKCIIVDDEPHAVAGLKRYIDSVPQLQLVKSYTDPLKALIEITAGEPVDLILMDVDMPGITGIELAKEVRQKTDKLIFTTAHRQYAFDAYEVEADAFLLKPYSLGKFIVIFNKLFPQKTGEGGLTAADDFMFIKSKEENLRLIKVNYSDIVAVESKMNYVQVHTRDKSFLTYSTLGEIAKKLLPREGFLQFQRSFIIAQDYIEYIEGNTIKMVTGAKITVGDYYKKYFNEFVDDKLFRAKRKG